MQMQAVRGAVKVEKDVPEEIKKQVTRLMSKLFEVNSLSRHEVVSIFFSQTKDLSSCNPATAAREAGYHEYAYFCLQELEIDKAPKRMIRILVHICCETERELQPVYIGEAKKLRPDLFGNKDS